jgi:hypothetical protein
VSIGLTRPLNLAGIILVFVAAMSSRADADLWGHVRFGLDTLHAGHLTAVDPYSFTQDTPWINHEWLSEAQMAAAYAAAGPAGLQLLKAAIVSIVTVLIWTALARVRLAVRLTIFLVLCVGTIHMWANIRPQLWSLLCLALVGRILGSKTTRLRWWLPLIFAFWANCHGGWVLGLGVLAVWAAASIVHTPAAWRAWVAVFGASAIATLCNPYGWRLWEFVGRTVRMARSIEEWQPLWRAPGLNWLPWILAVVAVLWLVFGRRSGEWLATGLALVMLAFGAVRVQRIESLFVVTTAILLAPWMAAAWPAAAGSAPPRMGRAHVLTRVTALVGIGTLAGWFAWRSWNCIPMFGEWVPDRASAVVLSRAEPGRLVTLFDWGEYAIWQFGPRLRVSIDGRRETVYSDARLAEADAIVAGSAAGLATLETWRPEYVWLPARSAATKQWLVAHGYRIDADTSRAFVAVRGDLPALVGSVEPVLPACFPG